MRRLMLLEAAKSKSLGEAEDDDASVTSEDEQEDGRLRSEVKGGREEDDDGHEGDMDDTSIDSR